MNNIQGGLNGGFPGLPTEAMLQYPKSGGAGGPAEFNGPVDKPHPLMHIPTEEMLKELERRGGHPGALASAALLCIRKSQDYNHGKIADPHNIDRSAYFPFGPVSYAQMLHTKAQRFNSLVQKQIDGLPVNFEGLMDTALDIINYAGFYLADQEKKK